MTAATGVLHLTEGPLDLLVGICLFHSITISENEERKGVPTFEMFGRCQYVPGKRPMVSLGGLEVFSGALARTGILDDVEAELLAFRQETHP